MDFKLLVQFLIKELDRLVYVLCDDLDLLIGFLEIRDSSCFVSLLEDFFKVCDYILTLLKRLFLRSFEIH
jgi:hypothetical protein